MEGSQLSTQVLAKQTVSETGHPITIDLILHQPRENGNLLRRYSTEMKHGFRFP